jgi:hypothetical protein
MAGRCHVRAAVAGAMRSCRRPWAVLGGFNRVRPPQHLGGPVADGQHGHVASDSTLLALVLALTGVVAAGASLSTAVPVEAPVEGGAAADPASDREPTLILQPNGPGPALWVPSPSGAAIRAHELQPTVAYE